MSDDYGAFDIKDLWRMIEGAKQALGPTRAQINAWRRTEQMLDQHASALRGFRDQVAASWPPESNSASAVYLGELDRLLEAVSATAEASASNAVHIGHVADVIEQTHTTLQPLHDEYISNEGKLAHYNAQLDAVGTVMGGMQGPLVGGIARGATKMFTESPVADGRQEQLVRQAREAMTTASGAARDASNNLLTPPEYPPPKFRGGQDVSRHLPEGGSGGEQGPTMTGGSAGAQGESGTQPLRQPASQPNWPEQIGRHSPAIQIPSSGDEVPHGPSHNPGPVLSDNPAPPFLPREPVLESAPHVGPIVNGGVPGNSSYTAPAWVAGGSRQQMNFGGSRVQATSAVVGGLGVSPSRTNSFSQGIGSPIADRARPSVVQKVNPVGGVIGRPESGLLGQAPLGGQSSSGKKSDRDRWDPDNPWSVDQGVAPVIAPGPVQDFDPGPGIIGRDR